MFTGLEIVFVVASLLGVVIATGVAYLKTPELTREIAFEEQDDTSNRNSGQCCPIALKAQLTSWEWLLPASPCNQQPYGAIRNKATRDEPKAG